MARTPQWKTRLIRLDMELRGWNQRILATKAGVGENTVSRLLRGLPTTAPQVKKVARALGQRIDRYLVIESDEGAPIDADPPQVARV